MQSDTAESSGLERPSPNRYNYTRDNVSNPLQLNMQTFQYTRCFGTHAVKQGYYFRVGCIGCRIKVIEYQQQYLSDAATGCSKGNHVAG